MAKRGKRKAKPEAVVAPDFPRYETTDFDDPESHALWALVGLPHLKGAPLGLPMVMLRWISKRLWDCVFRHHPELRTIKYRPPHTGQGVAMLSSAGEWVPIDDPEPEPADPAVAAAREVLGRLAPEQRTQIVNALGLTAEATAVPPEDDRVPYRKADGSTVLVTPAQARRYANAKKARRGEGS